MNTIIKIISVIYLVTKVDIFGSKGNNRNQIELFEFNLD